MAYAIEPEEPEVDRRVNALALFGLACLAISFPLVRVLVDAPEFFIAHGLGRGATIWFFALVVLVVPLLAAGIGFLPGRIGHGASTVALGLLLVLAAAGVLQPISGSSSLFILAVLAVTVGLLLADARTPAVRSTCAYLSVLALVLPLWVIGPSRTGTYIRSPEADLVEVAEPAGAEPDVPVVVIVFDEMPMVDLLTRDLAINRERFPNLAALADTSHWFRTASSVSPQTSSSVPALLSGVEPDLDKVPVASQYPTNIFLQLGRSYEATAYEPITALCPTSVCEAAGGAGEDGAGTAGEGEAEAGEDGSAKAEDADDADDAGEADDAGTGSGLRAALSDAVLVYRHAIGSDDMRDELPSISQGWAGFAEADDTGADLVDPDDPAAHGGAGYGTFRAQAAELADLIATEPTGDRPQLKVAHLIAPHMPWIAMPDGTVYTAGDPPGLTAQGGTLTWGSDEAERRAGHQRLLFQVGALDQQIGLLRAAMTEQGTWDDALVVITADHGVQFEPGGARAVGVGGVEVTNVPLFVKEPGQTEGVVDDRPALTIDLLPTVLGRLGIRSPSTFSGLDLFADDVPEQRDDAFLIGPGDRITPGQSLDALRAAVEHRSTWVDPDAGWDPVYQVGVDQPLVGRPVAELGEPVAGDPTWSRAGGESGRLVTVESLHADAPPATLLYVCGGTVAAAAPTSPLYASHERCPDPDSGELWYLDGAGAPHRTRRSP